MPNSRLLQSNYQNCMTISRLFPKNRPRGKPLALPTPQLRWGQFSPMLHFCAERKKIHDCRTAGHKTFSALAEKGHIYLIMKFLDGCVSIFRKPQEFPENLKGATVKNFPASAGRGCRNCPVDILTFYILKFLQLKSSPERAFSSYWFKFSNINLY